MPILFSFPGYDEIVKEINEQLNFELGEVTVRNFPDGESFVKLNTDVKKRDVILVCSLDNPDQKIMSLMFFASIVKELGAKQLGLVSPYLGYMRQDKRFNPGEVISSKIFAKFLSEQMDWLITIEPHLHRYKSLGEIYTIPCKVLHASDAIATWVENNVEKPLLIGPDRESERWVSAIAHKIKASFIVLDKIRHADQNVEISMPDIEKYKFHTPVLVDDIISTARTMTETIKHLYKLRTKMPVCIGVHAIFADNAYKELDNVGVEKIVTCNTIPHMTNKININYMLSEAIKTIGK